MKYFKNPADNSLWAYEADGSQDELIPKEFTALSAAEAEAAIAAQDAADVVVPDSATATQVIVWLKGKSNANGNFLTQVDTYCAGLPRGDVRRTAWEREPVFRKDSATFQAIAQLLQLTPEQVDEGLIEANQLTP